MAGNGNRERNRRRRLREKSSKYRQDESKKGYGISPRVAFIFFIVLLSFTIVRADIVKVNLLLEDNELAYAMITGRKRISRGPDKIWYMFSVDNKTYKGEFYGDYYYRNFRKYDFITVRYYVGNPNINTTSLGFYNRYMIAARRDARWTRVMNAMIEDHVPESERDKFLLKE